jgi:hypothetical protein
MRTKSGTVEEICAQLATGQWGNVTRAQLLAAGVSASGIKRRVAKGALIPEYLGVYRVGHRAPSRESHYAAAVLACGPGALLWGLAAAHLWGLVKGKVPPPSVVSSSNRRVPGLDARRARGLARADGTRRLGIPVTTVARTLVDLAALLPLDALARACHEAGVLHRTTPRQVERVLARRPNSPGAAKLRLILTGDAPVLLSKLERGFVKLLRKEGLPLPVTNTPAGGRRVDCRWPGHRLTVELDSYRFHNSRHSWDQGYRREREAYARGDAFRRYTWTDVFEDPQLMLAELHELLR